MNGQYNPGDVVLNNWKLRRLLGEGSYGKVYEAVREDIDGASYVSAIKIISIPQSESEVNNIRAQGMDDRSVTAYFHGVVDDVIKEVHWMASLVGNSNIVSYADHAVIAHQGKIGWDIIIRMELLTPLVNDIRNRKLSRDDVIRLGIDLCKALELCQSEKYKIIHRDIKPENVFRAEQGNYKLGDFGIARTVEATTGGLSKKGTYTYMAPEVYSGQPYNSSVDIYSLGIVMYMLLNDNRAPFLPPFPMQITHSDQDQSLARRMRGENLPPPKNADIRLAEIVLKSCAYRPQDRYSDPAQMRRDLELLKGDYPPLSPPPPKGSLIIQARDGQTGEFLAGAQFRIATAAGVDVGPNGIYSTDSRGEIRIDNLPPGAYVLTEVKTPAGYVKNAPFFHVVIGTNGGAKTVIVNNTRIKKKGGRRKALIIAAACVLVLICTAVLLIYVLSLKNMNTPSTASRPTDSSDPKPTFSAEPEESDDPEPTLSAEPEESDDPGPAFSAGPEELVSPEPIVTATPWVNPFIDVSEESWFYDAVRFVTERGMIQAAEGSAFDPHGIATRGTLITLLYRLAGEPAVEGSYFADVADGQYYANSANWAAEKGFVSGGGDNLFRPNDQITHEQVIVMFWRYAGEPSAEFTVLSGFPDADQVSSWAVSAMAWAVDVGIILHTDSRLNPKGDTTRAEAVTYIMRLYEAM